MSTSVQIASVFTAIGFKVNKKDLDKLQKQLGNLKKQLTQLQRVAKVRIDPNSRGLKTAKTELIGINRELAKIKNKVINVKVNQSGTGGGRRGGAAGGVARGAFTGSALGSQLGQFSAGVGIIGGAAFAAASVFKTTASLDAIKNALGAAAGGAKEGAKQFQFLKETSERIGINFLDNARSFQNFLAASNAVGFSVENSQEVFTATASAARVLGLSAADTNGAMRAMTQILSKGTVQAEELRGQLGERIPGAVGLMAKAVTEMNGGTEVTVQQLGKMLEQGQLISKDVMPFFAKQLMKAAEANGALARAQKSPLANLERMKNGFTEFSDQIGRSGFLKEASKMFVEFTDKLGGSSDAAESIGLVMATLTDIFRATVNVIGTIITGISLLNPWLLAMAAIIIALNFPILLWIAGIGIIILLIDDLLAAFSGKESVIGTFFGFITDKISAFVEGIQIAVDMIGLLFNLFKGIAIDKALEFLDPVIDIAKKGINFFSSDEGQAAVTATSGTGAGVPAFNKEGATPKVELVNTITITEDLPKVDTKVVNS